MSADRAFIPLHRPDLGDAECEAAARTIRSGWVSQGAEVEAFEREFAAFVGADHAVAVANGTAALELALRALGIGPGDEVITVSHSFIAAANVIRTVGAKTVFVDVSPDTLTMDPSKLKDVIGPATRAILAVHQVGMPCDLHSIVAVARTHGLFVIEDAACAVGSEILAGDHWERIGKPHGDVACFSFHGRKLITTGEGGMISCRDATIDQEMRQLRNHGMTLAAHDRHRAATITFEQYVRPGFNYRLSDIQAAIGREQLKRVTGLASRRRALAARYAQRLASGGVVTPLHEPEWARSNWQSYPVRLADHSDQNQVMQDLLDEGIATRRGIMCAHLEPAWAAADWICAGKRTGCNCAGHHCAALIESERGRDRHVLIPLYPSLTDREQDRVLATLHRSCGA